MRARGHTWATVGGLLVDGVLAGVAVGWAQSPSPPVASLLLQPASTQSNIHAVFDDGPRPTGKRYCMNAGGWVGG